MTHPTLDVRVTGRPGPLRRRTVAGLLAVWIAVAATALRAQTPAPGEELDPVTCWWRTTVSAIAVGQPFTLILTCALVETETASAVVDRARLDPKAIELAPFEVLGGRVAADVKAGARTFFQVEYTLRFINDRFFDQDVALPNLTVAYRIQMRAGNRDTATQGMERRFAMPRQSLRVTSLVSGDANDIRDAAAPTFADVAGHAARGRTLTIGGMLVMALAAVVAVAGVARALGATAWRPAPAAGLLSAAALVRGARRTLVAVRARVDAAGRWTADDIAQALTAARVVGACAVGADVSQRRAAEGETAPSGAIAVRGRLGTGPLVIVSGSTTAKTLSRLVAVTPRDGVRLDALQHVLATLTAAQYSDGAPLDDAALGQALATATDLATRLSFERLPLLERLTPWIRRRPLERQVS